MMNSSENAFSPQNNEIDLEMGDKELADLANLAQIDQDEKERFFENWGISPKYRPALGDSTSKENGISEENLLSELYSIKSDKSGAY